MSWGGVIIQTDGKNTIKALATKLAERHQHVSLRQAPVGSSASQGAVERYHRSVHGIVRTYKWELDKVHQKKLLGQSDLATWAVRHAAWSMDRFQRPRAMASRRTSSATARPTRRTSAALLRW